MTKETVVLLGNATCVPHSNSNKHFGALIVVYKELRRTNKNKLQNFTEVIVYDKA